MFFGATMPTFDHSLSMTFGVVLGGIIGRLMTYRQKLKELKMTEADSIRKELREDFGILQSKYEKLSSDLDLWKDRYYKLADENVQLRSRCQSLEIEIQELRKKFAVPAAG